MTDSQKSRFIKPKLTVCLIKHSLRQCNYGRCTNRPRNLSL